MASSTEARDGERRVVVNGREATVRSDPSTPLLYVLRDELGLTGTKAGCSQGECGSCTVHVGGRATKSCQLAVADVAEPVTTIEGLAAEDGGLHPVQRAFLERQAGQCAFCVPGLVMTAAALRTRAPIDDAALLDALDEHICRCGTHLRIVAAIRSVVGAARS